MAIFSNLAKIGNDFGGFHAPQVLTRRVLIRPMLTRRVQTHRVLTRLKIFTFLLIRLAIFNCIHSVCSALCNQLI